MVKSNSLYIIIICLTANILLNVNIAFCIDISQYDDILKQVDKIEEGEKKEDKFKFEFSIREDIDFLNLNKSSLLNPDNTFDLPSFQSESSINPSFNLFLLDKDLDIAGDYKLLWRTNNKIKEDKLDVNIKETFVRYNVSKKYFLSLGRIDQVDGVSYFWNPVDYFFSPLDDVSAGGKKSFKTDRIGTWMIMAELLGDPVSIKGAFSPKIVSDNKLFRKHLETNEIEKYFLSMQVDLFKDFNPRLFFFHEEHSNVGLELTGSVNEYIILQFEGNLIFDMKKEVVEETSAGNPVPFTIEESDRKGLFNSNIYPQFVLGMNVTFKNLINLVTEYYFNSEGWTESEHEKYLDALELTNNRFDDPFYSNFHGLYKGLIGQLNGLNSFAELRRHYVFTRISKNNILIKDLNAGQNILWNISDTSFAFTTTIEYLFLKSFSFNFENVFFAGNNKTEFGNQSYDFITSFSIEYIF